jgi:hypothetical protein
MTDSYWISLGVTCAVVAAGLAMGTAAVARGWVPRWGRRKIPRPTLWGYGTLVAAAGWAGFTLLGPVSPHPFSYIPWATLGLGMFLVGLIMQIVATDPPRPRRR